MNLANIVQSEVNNSENENKNTIKAQRATVKFCEGVEVDGYMLPSGEFRVGKTGAAIAVGYGKSYLTELESKSPKQLKALQDKGYTGFEEIVELDSIKGGGASAITLSLSDFRKLISFAASKGKPQAQALVDALLEVGLEDWFRLSFGVRQLTLEEKRERFYHTYSQTINWLVEDKEDFKKIAETDDRFLIISDYTQFSK